MPCLHPPSRLIPERPSAQFLSPITRHTLAYDLRHLMQRHWTLREELYAALHRWPSLLAFFALGSLLGWLAAYVWPSYTQATREIYVGLNPYRAYSDTNFLALAKPRYSNLDNYNYWQMSQLDQMLYLDEVLQKTLDALRQQDAAWQNVDTGQLRDMLDTNWRTAGAWELSAAHPNRAQAGQLAQAWSEVAAEQVRQAVDSAQHTFMIDQELQAGAAEILRSEQRQQQLTTSRQALEKWLAEAAALPAGQALEATDRWRIFALSAGLAQDDPAWQSLLAGQPAASALRSDYTRWVALVLAQIDADQAGMTERIDLLRQQRDTLQAQYSAEAERSLGLSPNLEIQSLGEIDARVVRPSATLALIGGFTGMLTWVFVQLIKASRRVQARE
jgi:hypothetical protein